VWRRGDPHPGISPALQSNYPVGEMADDPASPHQKIVLYRRSRSEQ
jgi:hypothetical protein